MKILAISMRLMLLTLLMPYWVQSQTNLAKNINSKELINNICDSLKSSYVFPEKAEMICAHLKAKLKSGVYKALEDKPEKLADQIGLDIQEAQHDPHMRVKYDPGFARQPTNQPTAEDTQREKKYWKEHNYMFNKVEILPGNIGYLAFNLFVPDIEGAKATIKAALQFVINTNALIIDLRENMGGSPEMVSQFESYFFKERTHMNDLIDRLKMDTTFLYADPAKSDGINLTMPVYILTSHNTFSGAEDFSYGMQLAKRAVVVGETTGGGAHPQMPFSIGQGFIIFIPFARSVNEITGTDWEGTGVMSEVQTDAKQALVRAQEHFFNKQMLSATEEKDRRMYAYYKNALMIESNKEKLLKKQLLPMAGTYGGLTIYLDGSKLFCRNDNNGGAVSELKQLTSNLFELDNQAQIKFIKDDKGIFASVEILVNDGSVFIESKTLKK